MNHAFIYFNLGDYLEKTQLFPSMPILDACRGQNRFKIKGKEKFNGEVTNYSWGKKPQCSCAGFPASRITWWLKA